MAYKKGILTIDNWQDGIGESPITGFGDIVNCEIHEPKGALKIAFAPTKISATSVDKLCTWITLDAENSVFYFSGDYNDVSTKSWKISTSDVVTEVSGGPSNPAAGLIWHDYVIVADRNLSTNVLDLYAYGPLSGSPAWSATFGSTTFDLVTQGAKYVPPMFTHPNDDTLYIGAGNDIASLQEVAGQTFDPATGGTFTFSASALDLPKGYVAEGFDQLGRYLAIGASVGGQTGNHRLYDGLLIPWDRVESSFALPISLEAGGVTPIQAYNNNLYFANGERGNFFITGLSSVERLPEIGPLKKQLDKLSTLFPDASEVINGELLVGVGTDGTELFNPCGVYGFKDGAWRRLTISTGEVGENDVLLIGSIKARDDREFYVAWQDDQTGASGIDLFGQNRYRYTSYKAYVESQLWQVGTSNDKKSFRMCEIVLNEPLATDQAVRISYRKDLSSSFTEIKTMDFSTYGATLGEAFGAAIADAQQVQIKIELTTGASSTATPSVKEVRLW